MITNSKKYLHPDLVEAIGLGFGQYQIDYPDSPYPTLDTTYRDFEEQNRLYEQGRTTEGEIVTYARGGQSPHNYLESFAFDVVFMEKGKKIWNRDLYKALADIILPAFPNIIWGGNWKFDDYPHFEIKNWKELI